MRYALAINSEGEWQSNYAYAIRQTKSTDRRWSGCGFTSLKNPGLVSFVCNSYELTVAAKHLEVVESSTCYIPC